jgi:hypothetical protein
MDLQLTTPALLFSTTSLLMLAYTNRFLAIARLIRELHNSYMATHDLNDLLQLKSLRRRLALIRNMQFFAVISLLLSVICMFLLFADQILIAKFIFGASLILMSVSLVISAMEIAQSINAISVQLKNIEESIKE